jgi:hypothetical protein
MFPSTTSLIKFNPCPSSIFSSFVDRINVAKVVAPTRFLTVTGMLLLQQQFGYLIGYKRLQQKELSVQEQELF